MAKLARWKIPRENLFLKKLTPEQLRSYPRIRSIVKQWVELLDLPFKIDLQNKKVWIPAEYIREDNPFCPIEDETWWEIRKWYLVDDPKKWWFRLLNYRWAQLDDINDGDFPLKMMYLMDDIKKQWWAWYKTKSCILYFIYLKAKEKWQTRNKNLN